jgi:hypothetical protein
MRFRDVGMLPDSTRSPLPRLVWMLASIRSVSYCPNDYCQESGFGDGMHVDAQVFHPERGVAVGDLNVAEIGEREAVPTAIHFRCVAQPHDRLDLLPRHRAEPGTRTNSGQSAHDTEGWGDAATSGTIKTSSIFVITRSA